jgi:hypothetical protein
MVNDPCAWGAIRPIVLVLGFSKGFTQATAFRNDKFEDIPAKNMRPRLTAALRRINLLRENEVVDAKFSATEHTFAFGSLVRCSLSRLNKHGQWGCTGELMSKAFTEPVRDVVRRCAETYLTGLPETLRLVILLGTADAYIAGCRRLIASLYGSGFAELNEVSYRTPGVIWVHIAHPSGANGHFEAWLRGSQGTTSGRKLSQALAALSGFPSPAWANSGQRGH